MRLTLLALIATLFLPLRARGADGGWNLSPAP